MLTGTGHTSRHAGAALAKLAQRPAKDSVQAADLRHALGILPGLMTRQGGNPRQFFVPFCATASIFLNPLSLKENMQNPVLSVYWA